MKQPTDLKLPHKHALGPLQTKRTTPIRSKHTRERIRRAAKRIQRRSEKNGLILESVRRAVAPSAKRFWIAVDHPQPEHAAMLWRSIAANEDPHRPGHAAICATPEKPL